MNSEIKKFKQWAFDYSESKRSGEWECDYSEWKDLYNAVYTFLSTVRPELWTTVDVADLLYVIARDNECEYLSEELAQEPERLLSLSACAIESSEPDAKWQLAFQLGELTDRKKDAENLLLQFVKDEHEYVSRRALLSLGKIKAFNAESLAEQAWETGHEYQRIAALWVFKDVGSNKLLMYLQKAEEDGRIYVVQNAREIQSSI